MPINQVKAGVVLNYVLIGVNILLGLLYTPYMLRMLGQNEYGLYSLVATIIAYLTLFDFGMGTAVVRYTAKFRAEGRTEESRSMFGMFFLLYTGMGIVAFIAGLCLYFNIDSLFDRTMSVGELAQARTMILLLLVNLAVTFPMSIFNSIITAYEEFVFQKVLNILRVVLSTAVIVVLLHAGYKAVAMVVVQTVFNLSVLVLNAVFCRYKLSVRLAFQRCRLAFIKEVMLFSFWAFLSDIMFRIYYGTGQFVLGATEGTKAVAVYALGITLMNMYMSFSTGIANLLLPRITAITTHKDSETQISDMFIRVGRIQYTVMAFLLSGFVLFGRQFVSLWAGAGYEQVYAIALIFFFPNLIPFIQNTGITILQARNQMQFRSVMLVCVAVASLVLQILLARQYGAIGCAVAVGSATLIGQGVILNVYYRKVQKIAIGHFWREIAKMSVVPIALTVVGCFVVERFAIDSVAKLAVCVVTYSIIYLPIFRLFSMNASEKDLMSGLLRKVNKKTIKFFREQK